MGAAPFVRWAGAGSMLGGTLWIIATAIHASKPVGCVGDECATRSMRETSAVEGALTGAALLLFAAAALALVALVRRTDRFGAPARTGAVLGLGGMAVLIAAGLIQALAFDGDFPLMPYFVIPGVAALIVGILLLTTTVIRSGVLPRWAAASLLIGSVAMMAFNEQTNAAWFGVPFGLGWMAVGLALWRTEPQDKSIDDGRD